MSARTSILCIGLLGGYLFVAAFVPQLVAHSAADPSWSIVVMCAGFIGIATASVLHTLHQKVAALEVSHGQAEEAERPTSRHGAALTHRSIQGPAEA